MYIGTSLFHLLKCGHPLFHKADRLFGPTSTWTVQNSLQNVDARKPLTQDCPPLLLDAMTGHHNSTGTHSTSLWLAFLASIQQERAMEGRFCSIQHHNYTLLSPLKIYWMPFKISTVPHSGHAAVVPIVSALEGLQRTNSLHTTNGHVIKSISNCNISLHVHVCCSISSQLLNKSLYN